MFFYFALSFIGFLFFIYLKKCNQFWKNQGVPCTSPSLLFGDIAKAVFCVRPLFFIYQDIYNAFPQEKYVGLYEFLHPILLIRDLKFIESILVKDFSYFNEMVWMTNENSVAKNMTFVHSKDWKYVRSKIVTSFSANKLRQMLVIMNKGADILDSVLSEKCQYEAVELKDVLGKYTVDMMTCCFFGLNTNALTENISPDFYYWLITTLPSPKHKKSVEDMIIKNKELRKSGSVRSKNVIQMMLDLRDLSEQKLLKAEENTSDVIIDDRAVILTMMAILVGTFEGSANGLTFCLYELALQPELQQRLRNEVQSVLKANQGMVTYDSLKQMTYCEMVINETFRKDTSITIMRRVCRAPFKIPNSPFSLNAGQMVAIPVRAIHMDEKYYPNPNKFDPDRFTPENIAARPPFTFLPFSEGPRICPGQRFAMMNLKLLLARILSKYEIHTCSKTEIPVIPDTRSPFGLPKNPIQLRIRKL